MKTAKRVAIVLAVILIALALLLQCALGSLVKTAVEALGPKLAGVPITVASVKTSLIRGHAEINDLTIGNPPGFKTARSIRISQVVVDLKMTSLLSSPRIVERVYIDSPEITYEKGKGSSNLGKIMDALGGDPTNAAPQPEAKQPAPKPEGAKLVIEDLRVEGARMRIGTKIGGSTFVVPLPPVHMTDIGKESGGASLKDTLRHIGSSIAGAGGHLVSGSAEVVGSAAKAVGRTGAAAAEGVGKEVGNTLESVSDLLKKH